MKLLRWTLAGASFYVMYKYAIGKKTKGEDVFAAPDDGTDTKEPAEPKAAVKKPGKPKAEKPKAEKPKTEKPRSSRTRASKTSA